MPNVRAPASLRACFSPSPASGWRAGGWRASGWRAGGWRAGGWRASGWPGPGSARPGRRRHPPLAAAGITAGYSPVWSSTSASGAFFLTDSIPFSADALRS